MTTPPATSNVTELVIERATATPDQNVYVLPDGGAWRGIAAAEFLSHVQWLARGLIASGLGLGERVAVLSASSFEAWLAMFAIWYAGGTAVPISDAEAPERLERILADPAIVRIFVSPERAEVLAHTVAASAVPAERLIPVTSLALEGEGGTLATLAGPGQGVSDGELERHRSAARPDSAALVLGLEAGPAAAEASLPGRDDATEHVVTHARIMRLAEGLLPALAAASHADAPRAVVDLPVSHPHAQTAHVACLAAHGTIAFTGEAVSLPELRSFRPTFMLGAPELFEGLYREVLVRVGRSGRSGLFARAAAVARAFSRASDDGMVAGAGPNRSLRLAHATYERFLYRRVRALFGGSLETVMCSDGPLDADLAHFFRGIGLPIVSWSVIEGAPNPELP